MKKYRLSIIARNWWSVDFLKEQFNDLFGSLFNISYHSPDTNPIIPIYNADMILLHEPSVLEIMSRYIKCDCPILLMRRTITSTALDKLRNIPHGSRAVVVNLNDYMARETLVNIYQLGIKDLILSTWSPEKKEFPEVDYIITPRIYNFLPREDIPKVVIGSRILTIELIMDILSYFNANISTINRIINRHLTESPNFFHGVNYMLENNKFLSVQLDLLFNKLSKGVAIVDKNNIITYTNNLFSEYLNIAPEKFLNIPVEELINLNKSLSFIDNNKEASNELIDIDNKKIIVNTDNLYNDDEYMGKVITLQSYNQVQYVQQTVHKKMFSNGNKAKYFFSDLKGNHPNFIKSIDLAKKFSNSDSPILILGESGTGKELMASAIHNHSNRRNNPYVAVNCGSIPNELLESEFFGYQEGAFTGSKKGGSIGLFEKANGGTIFLDEISEIPYNLQSRLLRVLQEQEIRKVGSNYNISIDVRVISATNIDLYRLVEENKFRKDLYYRLNVFQLNLPSLNRRKSDIKLMLKYFLGEHENKVSKEFYIFLNHYSWPGNIRELKNLVEYVIVTSEDKIDLSSLPEYFKKPDNFQDIRINRSLSLVEFLMLKLIYENELKKLSTGRANLTEYFSNLYYEISEVKIRSILKSLEKKEFIYIPKGRAGCGTTNKGKVIIEDNIE